MITIKIAALAAGAATIGLIALAGHLIDRRDRATWEHLEIDLSDCA